MTDILISDFVTGLLIFLRITGAIFTAPIFNNRSIPTIPKLTLGLILTYIIFFTVDVYSFSPDESLFVLAVLGIKEVLTGILMGFTLNFIFYGIAYAGMLLGFDMGLSVARVFDPSMEEQSNIIGQAVTIVAILIFLVINGHHFIINALAYSFRLIPLGEFAITGDVFNLLVKYSAGIFVIAIKIASPIMVSFFLLHLGAGIIARTIPSMNVFFVLFPLKLALGFLLFVFIMPIYVYVIRNLLVEYEDRLLDIIRAMV